MIIFKPYLPHSRNIVTLTTSDFSTAQGDLNYAAGYLD